MDSWLGQFGTGATGATTRRHDMTTTMPDPCSESVPPRGVTPWGTHGPGGVRSDLRRFFPWDGRSPVSHPTCDVPCPPRRTGRYRKGMISARPSYKGVSPPVVQGGQEIGLGSRNLRPRACLPTFSHFLIVNKLFSHSLSLSLSSSSSSSSPPPRRQRSPSPRLATRAYSGPV